MHTYRRADGLFTVGIYHPYTDAEGVVTWEWEGLRDYTQEYWAAAYANFLNGGNGEALTAARLINIRPLQPAEVPENEEA